MDDKPTNDNPLSEINKSLWVQGYSSITNQIVVVFTHEDPHLLFSEHFRKKAGNCESHLFRDAFWGNLASKLAGYGADNCNRCGMPRQNRKSTSSSSSRFADCFNYFKIFELFRDFVLIFHQKQIAYLPSDRMPSMINALDWWKRRKSQF